MEFITKDYTTLEIFIKPPSAEQEGQILLYDREGKVQAARAVNGGGYAAWIKLPVGKNSAYRLEKENVQIAMAYLSGNDQPFRDGVTFLVPCAGQVDGKEMADYLNAPNREQYHFTPFCNWMNDPNGLCYWRGFYHLFYQMNPYGQEWNNMYWGHAASKDLAHWVHLPVVLEPQDELLHNLEKKGGAFSGSAAPLNDRIRFYFTRHIDANGEPPTEYQCAADSMDGLTLEGERVAVPVQGPPVSADCRDPKVEIVNGEWSMVLGSCWEGTPSILRYTSADGERWNAQGPLLQEREDGVYTIECPDLFALDGKWAAVAGLMKHRDQNGRLQGTRYYIGTLKNGKLEVERKGVYDFGSNFYAVQSFLDGKRRIAIGWLSDFYNEHQPSEGGSYGSMSLPRELFIKGGKLWMRPVEEIDTLRGRTLYSGQGENIKLADTARNCYRAILELRRETAFDLLLARNGETSLSLRSHAGVTEFVVKGTAAETVRFPADVDTVQSVEIFMDRRVCEAFLNGGEAAGAKLFYSGDTAGCFQTEFADPAAVGRLEVFEMESCWKREPY